MPKTATPGTESEATEESPLEAVDSDACAWKEGDMELSWQKMLIRDDLLGLRDFFKTGMQIQVVEEKVRRTLCRQEQLNLT